MFVLFDVLDCRIVDYQVRNILGFLCFFHIFQHFFCSIILHCLILDFCRQSCLHLGQFLRQMLIWGWADRTASSTFPSARLGIFQSAVVSLTIILPNSLRLLIANDFAEWVSIVRVAACVAHYGTRSLIISFCYNPAVTYHDHQKDGH